MFTLGHDFIKANLIHTQLVVFFVCQLLYLKYLAHARPYFLKGYMFMEFLNSNFILCVITILMVVQTDYLHDRRH